MLLCFKCLDLFCLQQRNKDTRSMKPLRGVYDRLIPVYSEERGFCDPECEYGSIYRCRAIDEICSRVYTYIVGVGSWPKGGRNRGKKIHAGEVGLSCAALAYY